MSIEGTALNPVRLVAAALIGLVILLVLIIKFKIQAMVAILIGAISIGLIAGMPFEDIVTAVNDGIGNTLKGIALLVGLGSMFGAILEVSGGARRWQLQWSDVLAIKRLPGRLELQVWSSQCRYFLTPVLLY